LGADGKDRITVGFFKFMAEWGIWGILGLLVAWIPSVLVFIYFFPRKAINDFYIDTKIASGNETYSRVVSVELRNNTNETLYILSEGVVFGDAVLPSPLALRSQPVMLMFGGVCS
jgi:hypothetical protein